MRRSTSRLIKRLAQTTAPATPRPLTCSGARRSSTTSTRQWSTPLAKTLGEAITTTGPISVAAYMRQCLTFPDTGYYTQSADDKDPFGTKGDFVTSPEISQIFGELLGLWFVAEWIAQGKRTSGVYLMEMGPGRGTLMDDMLRSIRNFKPLAQAIDAIYMVEASPSLRKAQHKLLCRDNPMQEIDIGYQSTCKYTTHLNIIWCEDIRFVPRDTDSSPFIVAHEFFDALPIHVFESVKASPAPKHMRTPTGLHKVDPSATATPSTLSQWRELVVSPTSPYATHDSLNTPQSQRNNPLPEFSLTRSQAPTPHSLFLPEQSSRYKALKDIQGSVVEISPESQTYAADFAVRIGGGTSPSALYTQTPSSADQTLAPPASRRVSPRRPVEQIVKKQASGAALILDYGTPSSIPANSLRGIKQHAIVSPLSEPGKVDISADVDFLALAESAINASLHVQVHGPLDQATFLTAMGIEQRAAQLVKLALDRERARPVGKTDAVEKSKSDLTDVVNRIDSGWRRLVDRGPQGMGRLYQVMAILPHVPVKQGELPRRPVGFGGDVSL
jgi:NADH dehydrogenase [ubiquinone] 1 alpha subcomplex assembly factor 7